MTWYELVAMVQGNQSPDPTRNMTFLERKAYCKRSRSEAVKSWLRSW